MTYRLTLRPIGNSRGAIFPKDLLAKLRADEKTAELFVTETPDGLLIRNYDPTFVYQMSVAEQIMAEDRDVLKKLAE